MAATRLAEPFPKYSTTSSRPLVAGSESNPGDQLQKPVTRGRAEKPAKRVSQTMKVEDAKPLGQGGIDTASQASTDADRTITQFIRRKPALRGRQSSAMAKESENGVSFGSEDKKGKQRADELDSNKAEGASTSSGGGTNNRTETGEVSSPKNLLKVSSLTNHTRTD